MLSLYSLQGDLFAYLKEKGALKPRVAVKFALDIARLVESFHPELVLKILYLYLALLIWIWDLIIFSL